MKRRFGGRGDGQQTSVEDVVALALNEIIEEQVWVGEDIVEAFMAIEMVLEIIILMIEEQENVVFVVVMPKQDNANEDVELHAY